MADSHNLQQPSAHGKIGPGKDLGPRSLKLFHRYLFFAFIPVIILGAISTMLTSRWDDELVVQQVEAHRKQLVQYHAQHIREYFDTKVDLLKSLAAAPVVQAGDPKTIMNYLRSVHGELKETFEGLYFSQPDGTVYSPFGRTFSIRDRYFFPQFTNQLIIISKVLVSKDTGKKMVLICVPAYDKDHRWIGSIGAPILLEQIVGHISDIGVGTSGFSLLVDEDGVVLSKKPFVDNNELSGKLRPPTDDNSHFLETSIKRVEYFAAYQRVPPLDWTVVLFQPKQEALKNFPRYREMNFMILGLCALLALAFAESLSQRVSREEEQKRRELEQRLLFSEKMEALGVLAGGVAHDFNNILASISGFSELAIRKLNPGNDAESYLAHVLTACQRGRDLVERILTFSRRREPVFESLDIAAIAEEVVAFIKTSLPPAVQCELVFTEENLFVRGDRTQLFQVLVNLCTNAGYAMQESGGKILVALTKNPDGRICLRVRDTGVGIPSEQQQRIFEPFFTTKPAGQGSGLGLSVVHSIIQAHGGSIGVESRVGQTEFSVFLPAAEPPEKMAPKPKFVELPEGTKGGRILVIDDDRSLLKVARLMLEGAGYQVEEADSADNARKVIDDDFERFDVVITDHTMPGMSGLEFAIQLLKRNPEAKIILCTGYAAGVDEKTCLEKGIRALLPKPYSRGQLIELVSSLIA